MFETRVRKEVISDAITTLLQRAAARRQASLNTPGCARSIPVRCVMAMFRSGIVLRRRWFLLLTLLAFAWAWITGGILWHSVEMSSVGEIQTRVDAIKPLFRGIRLFMIALVAVAWPFVTGCLHRWGWIEKGQAMTMSALHWRIATWLVVIELVLGQNLLGQVLAVLQGSRV